MVGKYINIPDTLDDILLAQDQCQNLQMLLKEYHQTSPAHCAKISAGLEKTNLQKYPVYKVAL